MDKQKQFTNRWGSETTTLPLLESSQNCQVSEILSLAWGRPLYKVTSWLETTRMASWLAKSRFLKEKCDKCVTFFFCQDILGNLNTASAAMYGMKDSKSFAKVFLDHPVFGER